MGHQGGDGGAHRSTGSACSPSTTCTRRLIAACAWTASGCWKGRRQIRAHWVWPGHKVLASQASRLDPGSRRLVRPGRGRHEDEMRRCPVPPRRLQTVNVSVRRRARPQPEAMATIAHEGRNRTQAHPAEAQLCARRHPLVTSAREPPTATLLNTCFDARRCCSASAGSRCAPASRGRRWLQTVRQAKQRRRPVSPAGMGRAILKPSISLRSTLPKPASCWKAPRLQTHPLFTTDFRHESRRLTPSPGVSV